MDTIDKKANDKNFVTEEKEFDQVKESAWQGLSLFLKSYWILVMKQIEKLLLKG